MLLLLLHVQPTYVDKRSNVFSYTIEEDERYYLTATSGFYRGQFGPFSGFFRRTIPFLARKLFNRKSKPESTSWIGKGVPHMLDTQLNGWLTCQEASTSMVAAYTA